MNILNDGHHWLCSVLGSIPIPSTQNKWTLQNLGNYSHEVHNLFREYDAGNEISTIFIEPWLLQILYSLNPMEKPITCQPFASQFEWADWESLKQIRSIVGSPSMPLKQLAKLCVNRKELLDKRVEELQRLIDEEVYRIYEISEDDRKLIERELALKRGEVSIMEDTEEESESEDEKAELEEIEEPADTEEKIREHVRRLLSFYIKQSIEEDEDGIVPLDGMFDDNLLTKVRKKITRDFGEERAEHIEIEIGEILGKSLEEWLAKDYFDYHFALYKRRPIFWQLVSYRIGKSKAPGIFSCFIHYHKLTRDTIPKIIAFYLAPVKTRASREKERLQKDLEQARAEDDRKRINRKSKEYEQAANIVDELDSFEMALLWVHNPKEDKMKLPKNPTWVQEKVKEIRDEGWNPVIDYGVMVNIEPLKEAMVMPTSVEKVK